MPVRDHDRTERAAAEAVLDLEGELAVGGRPPGADAELALELLEDPRRTAHVTGGAHAARDQVLAARLEAEPAVERRDAVDVDERPAGLRGDGLERMLRQVGVLRLDVLEDGDQHAALATMLVDDPRDLAHGPTPLGVLPEGGAADRPAAGGSWAALRGARRVPPTRS